MNMIMYFMNVQHDECQRSGFLWGVYDLQDALLFRELLCLKELDLVDKAG